MKNLKMFPIVISLISISISSSGQKLSDSMFNSMSKVEMGDYYQKKSKGLKAGGYTLMGVGLAMITAATALAFDDMWSESDNAATANVLAFAGLASMAASYPVFASGAKAKGRAEMLYMNPDPSKVEALTNTYRRKARTNSIIAWSLLGVGFVVPMIMSTTADEYNGISPTAETISRISSLGIFVSIPFFMEAAKNKGRVSILTRTEHLPSSFIQGSGTHRSIGIGFPIGN